MIRRRQRRGDTGKKVVYITPYRNLASQMREMYAKKGYRAEISSEHDAAGQRLFVVYVFTS